MGKQVCKCSTHVLFPAAISFLHLLSNYSYVSVDLLISSGRECHCDRWGGGMWDGGGEEEHITGNTLLRIIKILEC